MRDPGRILVASALLGACSCGAASAKQLGDEGFDELGRSNYSGALAKFDEALTKTDRSSLESLNLELGAIEALIHVDSARARQQFLELTASQPDKLGVKDYKNVASKLASAKKFDDAIALLENAKSRFPSDASVHQLGDAIAQTAKNAGDESAVSRLASLGYISK